MMKTNRIIAIYLPLFLLGVVFQGFSQGIVNDGGYITGSSTSYTDFSGSGDMLLTGTTADQTTFGHVNVNFTGSGNYKLTIPDSSMITIDGNLSLSDTLLLEANSSSEMASLITNGTVTGSFAKVQQYLSASQYHQVSSPVSNDSSDVYLGIWLLDWSEADSSWTYVSATNHPLDATKGFFVWANSNSTVEFEGLLNTGNQSASLTYNNNSGEGHGWNLVGNPYPSALQWANTWTLSSVTATIYVHNGANYVTYNYNTGGTGGFNGEIMPTQGFWVKANGSSPTMTIPNSERVHSANTFYKSASKVKDLFSLEITGNGYENEALIGMAKSGTHGFDADYDAYKLYGIEASPQIFSYIDETEYTTNILGEINENETLALGIRTGSAGEYTLSWKNLGEFNTDFDIYLEDLLLNKIIEMRKVNQYAFTTKSGFDKDRFILHFSKGSLSNIDDSGKTSIDVYSNQHKIFVNYQSSQAGQVEIFDLLGKQIVSQALNTNALNTLKIDHEGYYIVRIQSLDNVSTTKVYIQ